MGLAIPYSAIVMHALYIQMIARVLGTLFLIVFLICELRKRFSTKDNLERLLKTSKAIMPKQYSYAEIKIITGHFREKLGQGGFGTVFKGSLFDGRPVAVKLLKNTKGNGEDFINEVATVGTVHRVNVVHLVGFCSEGKIRALVYEFMPKGSLDKYIFSTGMDGIHTVVGWRKMHEIALGIARGIDYLHRGCEMCILHFDIKPHNILLDDSFCPKISDFGLAKLRPTPNTMVLTNLRGTIGYIAPEQISRRGVSPKTDVYSYGMLLLEMAERRRNSDPLVGGGSSSGAYFPTWIYNRLQEGGEFENCNDGIEFEEEIMKKLAIVGLWCIQMAPESRPSMREVIDMLEGSLEALTLPSRPFLRSPPRAMEDDDDQYSVELSGSIDIDSIEGVLMKSSFGEGIDRHAGGEV